jgi:hypothetical protein
MSRPTDHANIDLHQLALDSAYRRTGKIIWQPRIGAWLAYKNQMGIPLPDWCEGLDEYGILRAMGVSARLYAFNACYVSDEPDVQIEETVLNEQDKEIRIITPVGTSRCVVHSSTDNWTQRQREWLVSSEEDLRIAIWREENRTWRFDQATYDKLLAENGDLGAPMIYLPRTNIQSLYIDSAGVEGGIMLLADHTDTCEVFFRALDDSHDRLIDVVNDCPIQLVNFGDNVHADTLGMTYFKKYLLPAYQRRCEKLRGAGKFTFAHWDGNCKPLLPYVHETGLDGIEAITPEPQGDVTLEECAAALGDMFMIDGLPAVYFDTTFSEQELIDCTKKMIDLFAPNLIMGISDEIATFGDIDRIHLVTQIIDDYNASIS